jgi:hypothetical protein
MRNLYLNFGEHLSDECLTRLTCDELWMVEKFLAKRHLAACWRCRARYGQLERAALDVVAYREYRVARNLPLSEVRRDSFIARMGFLFQETAPHPGWMIRRSKLPRFGLPDMNPMLAAGLVLACASIVCIGVWFAQLTPNISSNALLVRAETWDEPSTELSSGIVYQKVRITTPGQSMERAIYRDIEERRHAKPMKLPGQEEQLKDRLTHAGLNWDNPLSATSYQDWHDRQRVREDKIARAGNHLLRLITTIPDGVVAAQSLTVRDTDFHPVERSITFRNSEPVEIAELDYRVLPWSAVNANDFETGIGAGENAPVADFATPKFRLPSVVTDSQLDEAELSARLTLNQLQADTDEQLRIERHPQEIEVKGLVETEQRKRQLESELRLIPHLRISILSFEDLRNQTESGAGITALKMESVSSQPSPLERYFSARGRRAASMSELSHKLLNSALSVSRESKAIAELSSRFSVSEDKLTDLAAATLTDLIHSHRERLVAALAEEQRVLAEIQGSAGNEGSSPGSPGERELTALAERNLALTKELTFGSDASSRGAEAILQELAESVSVLRANARQVHARTQNTVLEGKK